MKTSLSKITYREDFRGSPPNFEKSVFNKFRTTPPPPPKSDNEITSLLIVKQNFRLYIVLFDLCFQSFMLYISNQKVLRKKKKKKWRVSSATDPIFVDGWICSRDTLYFVSLLFSIYLVLVDGFSWWGLLYDLGVANMMIWVIWDFGIWLKQYSLGLKFCILAWKKLYRLDGVR